MSSEIPITPNPSPPATLDNLRAITARNLPGAALVAQVRAAGFEVRSFGPTRSVVEDDLGNEWITYCYAGECEYGGTVYYVTTMGPVIDDPAHIATAKLMVEVAAIHKAAEGT